MLIIILNKGMMDNIQDVPRPRRGVGRRASNGREVAARAERERTTMVTRDHLARLANRALPTFGAWSCSPLDSTPRVCGCLSAPTGAEFAEGCGLVRRAR